MDLRDWYYPDQKLPLDPARTAFEEAKSVFASALTRDPEKVRLVESANDLDGFFQLVKQREKAYEDSRGAGKVRKWLAAVSSRIAFYGSIMDVLFQQSPAWVSLAWGAMKLVFVGVENHEALLSTFASAICRIGAALPRLERSLVLFPTPEIISGAANLYAQIMRFLTRAMQWYNASKGSHVRTAFFKPKPILLDDILEEIDLQTAELSQWINQSSHAEQRDMHIEQQALILSHEKVAESTKQNHALLQEIMRVVGAIPSEFLQLQSGQARIEAKVTDTNERVYDIQLNAMLEACAKVPDLDSHDAYRMACVLRNRRRRSGQSISISDKIRPKLQHFSDQADFSVMVIEGSMADRNVLRDASTDLVGLLQEAHVPVLWVLDQAYLGRRQSFSPAELLKSLCFQALQLNSRLHTEKSMSLKASQMQSAQSVKEWLDILASALSGFDTLYIIINIAAQTEEDFDDILPQDRLVWYDAFEKLSSNLRGRGMAKGLKVVLVSDSSHQKSLISEGRPLNPESIIKVPRQSQAVVRKRHILQSRGRPLKIRKW